MKVIPVFACQWIIRLLAITSLLCAGYKGLVWQFPEQSRSAPEMDDMQEELEQLQESKVELEKELEATLKTITVVQISPKDSG